MLNNVKSVVRVVFPAGLALLLCTQTAQAQRRGTLQRQNSGFGQGMGCGSGQAGMLSQFRFGQGMGCGCGQTGMLSQFSTGLQPQLSLYYLQLPITNPTPLDTQALANALQQQQALTPQQQYALSALQQYVYEAQLTGTDPSEALQSALLAMQINQRNAARRVARLQNR